MTRKYNSEYKIANPTLILVRLLASANMGETVKFTEMKRVTNLDIQGAKRHLLTSALHIARRDHGVVYQVVVGVGYRRLSDAELIGRGRLAIKKVRKAATKGGREMDVVDPSKLTGDQSLSHSNTRTIVSIIEEASRKRTVEGVVKACGNRPLITKSILEP